jgi:hypothetical protein
MIRAKVPSAWERGPIAEVQRDASYTGAVGQRARLRIAIQIDAPRVANATTLTVNKASQITAVVA